MASVARINDLFSGTCCCHDDPPCIHTMGMIIVGSYNVVANSLGVARVGDIGIGFCGHMCVVSSGSGSVVTNGIPTARIGDSVTGCIDGTIITGSPNVLAG
jgi:uncharacterized Zn-binding protein involved in type VI secretion